jgi:hypothetical protein
MLDNKFINAFRCRKGKEVEKTKLTQLKKFEPKKARAPARPFQGVRGKSESPDAFRHFGVQNGKVPCDSAEIPSKCCYI